MTTEIKLPPNVKTKYTNIAKACLLIAVDNGGINWTRSLRQWGNDFNRFISEPHGFLPEIDAWLGSLSAEDLEMVCFGEQGEADSLCEGAPPFTNDLLNSYFDHIC
jgi:hypothetical protein